MCPWLTMGIRQQSGWSGHPESIRWCHNSLLSFSPSSSFLPFLSYCMTTLLYSINKAKKKRKNNKYSQLKVLDKKDVQSNKIILLAWYVHTLCCEGRNYLPRQNEATVAVILHSHVCFAHLLCSKSVYMQLECLGSTHTHTMRFKGGKGIGYCPHLC